MGNARSCDSGFVCAYYYFVEDDGGMQSAQFTLPPTPKITFAPTPVPKTIARTGLIDVSRVSLTDR